MTTLSAPPAVSSLAVPGVGEALARQRTKRRGRLYALIRWAGAALFVAVFLALLVTLLQQAAPALGHMGLSILWRGWNPQKNELGAGVFIVGTLLTTALALLLAVPVGVGAAAMFAELAPRWIAGPLTAMVEFLAAIPSVVVGLWGLIVLTPLFARDVEPFLKTVPGLDAAFHGEPLGSSILLAGVVLAIMILPTVVALSRVAMTGVALADREAGMALAATRWQVVRKVVIPGAGRGIRAAVTLAMGRAMGEAIAVAFVIGNGSGLPHSLLSPGASLGSAIVSSFSEALPGSLLKSGVVALVLVLLAISVAVNVGGQILMRTRRPAVPPRGPADGSGTPPALPPDPGLVLVEMQP